MLTYIYSYLSIFFIILIHKSLNLVIRVWNYMMFKYFDGSLTYQVLYLYILPTLVLNVRASLGDALTLVQNWHLKLECFAEGSLTLDDPFWVSFLCILKYISLYFIQNSMQVTSKWLFLLSASHIILK